MNRRMSLIVMLLGAFTASGCCGPADPCECEEPTPVFEVTSIAYRGHVVFDKQLMLEDDFLRYLWRMKQYQDRYAEALWDSPLYFEWRNVSVMDEPFVVCDGGYWISCGASPESVGGVPRELWCVDRNGASES